VKTGVQEIWNKLKILDSGACPGPDPGFAGMTGKGGFRFLAKPSILNIDGLEGISYTSRHDKRYSKKVYEKPMSTP
jgi:hypothetical protein